MKNLVFVVVAALAVVVSSSANASEKRPVKFCVLKDSVEVAIKAIPKLQVIMVVDEKYAMGLLAEKVTDQENTSYFNGGYGALTEAGITEAKEVQVEVETDGVDVKSLKLSNNKTLSTAFQIDIQDLVKDPVGEEQMKSSGQAAQCYTGSISLVKGLEV